MNTYQTDFHRWIEEQAALLKAGQLDQLKQARGLWADRQDLPDFDVLRQEWDRGLEKPREENQCQPKP